MNWIKRKFSNYIKPIVVYVYNSVVFFLSDKKKDTCIVLADFDTYGGTRTYFEQICRFLNDKNRRVICLVSERQKDGAFLELMQQLSFQYHVIPDKNGIVEHTEGWSWKLKAFYLRTLVNDLNFFFSIFLKYNLNTLIISSGEAEKYLYLYWLPLKKLIYVLHTLPHRNIGKIGSYTLRKNLGRDKSIVAVSEFAKRSILKQWQIIPIDQQYVHTVSNYFEPVTNNTLTREKKDVVRILTIGHLVPYKNPLLWIEIAKSVLHKIGQKNIEFTWAGAGEQMEKCSNEVRGYTNIKFIGYQKDVDELYASSDIYLQPSQIESQGISVLGAMYYSLPCIVSNTGGLPESVVDEESGYVIPNAVSDEYVEKILYLLQNEKFRIAMGIKGRKLFEEKFGKVHWTKKMNELLDIA